MIKIVPFLVVAELSYLYISQVTHYLGGENYVFWGGREGYQSLLNTDMGRELDHLVRFSSVFLVQWFAITFEFFFFLVWFTPFFCSWFHHLFVLLFIVFPLKLNLPIHRQGFLKPLLHTRRRLDSMVIFFFIIRHLLNLGCKEKANSFGVQKNIFYLIC